MGGAARGQSHAKERFLCWNRGLSLGGKQEQAISQKPLIQALPERAVRGNQRPEPDRQAKWALQTAAHVLSSPPVSGGQRPPAKEAGGGKTRRPGQSLPRRAPRCVSTVTALACWQNEGRALLEAHALERVILCPPELTTPPAPRTHLWSSSSSSADPAGELPCPPSDSLWGSLVAAVMVV